MEILQVNDAVHVLGVTLSVAEQHSEKNPTVESELQERHRFTSKH